MATISVETRMVSGGEGPTRTQYVWSLMDAETPIVRDRLSDGVLWTADRLYYLADANHNVTAVTDGAGAVLERYDYDAYGTVTVRSADGSQVLAGSSVANTRLFAGLSLDPATGLYDARARWYNPATGTFLGRDPLGFAAGDMNVYRYVGGDPADATDPSGLCAESDPTKAAYNAFLDTGDRGP